MSCLNIPRISLFVNHRFSNIVPFSFLLVSYLFSFSFIKLEINLCYGKVDFTISVQKNIINKDKFLPKD